MDEKQTYHSCIICGLAFKARAKDKTCSKACSKINALEYAKRYRTENKSKLLEYGKLYRAENRDKALEYAKLYRTENKSKLLEYRIKISNLRNEYNKTWYRKNKGKHLVQKNIKRQTALIAYSEFLELGLVDQIDNRDQKAKEGRKILRLLEENND